MEQTEKKNFASKFEILDICMSSEHFEKISKIALKAIKENKFEKDIANQIKINCDIDQLLNNDPFEEDIDIDGNRLCEKEGEKDSEKENEKEGEKESEKENEGEKKNEEENANQAYQNKQNVLTEQNVSFEQNKNSENNINGNVINDITASTQETNSYKQPLKRNLRSHNIGSWQCIVGKNFAFSVNYQFNCMIYFQHKITKLILLIYKSL